MPQLSANDYFDAVAQLLEATKGAAGGLAAEENAKGGTSGSLTPEMMEAACAWMEKPTCGPSVRTAANFVKLAAKLAT
jgi:hypothetical protein